MGDRGIRRFAHPARDPHHQSDDVIGRAKAYEIHRERGDHAEPNIPESFNVLVHELRGLPLNYDGLEMLLVIGYWSLVISGHSPND